MISSEGAVQQLIDSTDNLLVLHFTAPWSEPCKTIAASLNALSQKYKALKVHQVDTEKVAKFSESNNIDSVPTCLFYLNKQHKETIAGLNVPRIAKTVEKLILECDNVSPVETPAEDLNARLARLTKMAKCVAFIKGSPQAPRCKFTRALMELFSSTEIEFSYFDILSDNDVREGLKKFGEWPTYPQVWLDGQLFGGLDILKEMHENGELITTLPVKQSLNTRLKNIINSHKVMLFMKGNSTEPRCGFSKTTVGLLAEYSADYKTFDILTDDEVRQGLKVYSEWPTYPQLYVNGELIGGLDIIRELHEAGELGDALKMKLEAPKKKPQFSLFSPDNCLPTEERSQFRARANDVFGTLSRDTVTPSELTSAMLPPPPPPPPVSSNSRISDQVKIAPSPELYNSLVSDKADKGGSSERRPRAFGSNKRCFRAQHEIHPQKYTKYTLKDTDLADDKQNKVIALHFLNELKEDTNNSDEPNGSEKDKKITFKRRPRKSSEDQGETGKAPVRQKNVIVQEEYVIGQTKSVSKRTSRDVTTVAGLRRVSRDEISRDDKKSDKGKQRGRFTACYLDDEEDVDD